LAGGNDHGFKNKAWVSGARLGDRKNQEGELRTGSRKKEGEWRMGGKGKTQRRSLIKTCDGQKKRSGGQNGGPSEFGEGSRSKVCRNKKIMVSVSNIQGGPTGGGTIGGEEMEKKHYYLGHTAIL